MIVLDVWVSGENVQLAKPGEEQVGTQKKDGPVWERHWVQVDADASDPDQVKLNMARHALFEKGILK